jgi:nitrate reductase gamma subunit
MTAVVYGIIYVGILSFLIASIARAVRYASQPIHLRWELYPVPHESAERVAHGGSYFEELDHWTKPSAFNWVAEMKFMIPEILFLKGLWEYKRSLWYRSFPFHFGLYLVIAAVMLVLVSALLVLFAPAVMAGALGAILTGLFSVCGAVGAGMAIAGAFGLIMRRLRDPDLQNYTAPGDIFNLLFFIVAFGILIVGYALRGPDFPGVLAMTTGLLTFDTSLQVPGLISAGLILTSLLTVYVPLTHMAHFIAKYFTYHSVRWDDAQSSGAVAMQKKLAEYLTYRPNWSAPHIGADGKKTWADIATANPFLEGDKK